MNNLMTTGSLIKLHFELLDRIIEITGSERSYEFTIDMSYIKHNYRIEDNNELVILDETGYSDWLFNIATKNHKSEVLLMGIENDLKFIMCYEDYKYFVIVLDKDLEQ